VREKHFGARSAPIFFSLSHCLPVNLPKSEPAQGGEPAPVLFAVRLTGGLRRHRGAKGELVERTRHRREVEMNRKAALEGRGLFPAEEAPRPPRRRLREPRRLESPERGRGMER
jgi:hypothetical protein